MKDFNDFAKTVDIVAVIDNVTKSVQSKNVPVALEQTYISTMITFDLLRRYHEWLG